MESTTIYVSVTDQEHKKHLVIDGDLLLLRELLSSFHFAPQKPNILTSKITLANTLDAHPNSPAVQNQTE